MSGIRALRDVSIEFGNSLQAIRAELFSVKVPQTFEDTVVKKVEDITLLTSKLRLLQAKTLADSPEIKAASKDEVTTISDYTETVAWKLIEQQVVKSLLQSNTVKSLVTTPDKQLDPELIERKEKIIAHTIEYSQKETTLRQLNSILKAKEAELLSMRQEWDSTLGKLKDSQNVPKSEERSMGPLHKKLQMLTDKMELMRWVISKLVTSRTTDYDWSTDPHRRLGALALTRQCYTVDHYTDN